MNTTFLKTNAFSVPFIKPMANPHSTYRNVSIDFPLVLSRLPQRDDKRLPVKEPAGDFAHSTLGVKRFKWKVICGLHPQLHRSRNPLVRHTGGELISGIRLRSLPSNHPDISL